MLASSVPGQLVEVDITASDDNTNALAGEYFTVLKNRGQRHRARRLHHDLHALPDKLHRVDYFLLGRGEDVGDVVADEVPGKVLEGHLEAVRHGVRRIVRDDVTRLEATVR